MAAIMIVLLLLSWCRATGRALIDHDKHDGRQQMFETALMLGFVLDQAVDLSQIVADDHVESER